MDYEKEKLVVDNIKIAYKLSFLYFKKFGGSYELDDLKSTAYIGLVKAANTFRKELNYQFSTYAYACIRTEIYRYAKENQKYQNQLYLSDKVEGTDGLYIEDFIASDTNLEEDIADMIQNKKLLEEIEKLPERYKLIMKYKLQGLSTVDIGKKLNLSQPTICKDYNRAINILRMKLIDWRWYNV